jgi:hypothetical protein
MPTCTRKAVKESNASRGEQKIVDLLDRLQRLLYPSPLTQNGEKVIVPVPAAAATAVAK